MTMGLRVPTRGPLTMCTMHLFPSGPAPMISTESFENVRWLVTFGRTRFRVKSWIASAFDHHLALGKKKVPRIIQIQIAYTWPTGYDPL